MKSMGWIWGVGILLRVGKPMGLASGDSLDADESVFSSHVRFQVGNNNSHILV